MACHLVGPKPSSETMLEYCKLDPLGTNFNNILIKIHTFSFKKIHLKMLSGKWWSSCLRLTVVVVITYPCLNPDANIIHEVTYPYQLYSWKWIYNQSVDNGNVWFVVHRKHKRECRSLPLLGIVGILRRLLQNPCDDSWHASAHQRCWCRLYCNQPTRTNQIQILNFTVSKTLNCNK